MAVDPVVLVEGEYQWHETAGGATAYAEYYSLASQAVAHPCIYEGGGGEVYFNNRKLPVSGASLALGPWSGNLTISLDWTDDDWRGTELRLAYQAPGLEGLRETPAIGRGTTLTLPIQVDPANATAAADPGSGWSLWLCLPEDTSGGPQQPFMGSAQVTAVYAPDPVPEESVVPQDEPEGRTARTGGTTSDAPTQPAL